MIALLNDTLTKVVGRGTVFRYRLSGGKHPVSHMKTAEAALADKWGDMSARLFKPPPELPDLTVNKMIREKAKEPVSFPSGTKQTQYHD